MSEKPTYEELEQRNKDFEKEAVNCKRTEEVLRESEEKHRALLETTSQGCWMIDPERKTIEVNQALCNMLGYRQDEMIGKTPFDFVDDENRKIFIEQTSKISTTHHRSYEITLKKKNGQNLHTYFNATTIRDESGEAQGSFAFVTDITERKQAEEALRVANERLELAMDTGEHGFWDWNIDTNEVFLARVITQCLAMKTTSFRWYWTHGQT